MPKYRFTEIAINSTEKKKPTEADKETYIGLEHLDTGTLKVSRWGSEIAPIGEKLIMRKGDVLFGKRRAYQKKVGIAPFDGIFSAHGMVLRPREDVVTKEYFPLFISSDYFLNEAIRISVGSLSPTVNWKDLKDLCFELPTIEEQRRIAPIIWAAIEAKNAYRTLIARADELVKSQFIELFAGEAKQVKLGECAFIEKGTTITRENVIAGEVPVVAAGIEPSCYHNQSNRPAGAITISASGANAGYVNYWNIPIFASDCNTVFPKSADLDSIFLYCRLKVMQEEIFAMQRGSGQPHVYAKDLAQIMVPIPEIQLQRRFAAFVEQSDKSKFSVQIAIYRDVWRRRSGAKWI